MWEVTFIELRSGLELTDTVEAATIDDALADLKAARGNVTLVKAHQVCSCHHETGSHELCCGHDQGRNPNCPIHGDGSYA